MSILYILTNKKRSIKYKKRLFFKGDLYVVYFCNFVSNICCTNFNLAKIGIEGVNSNLATAVRTIVVVLMAWLMVFITGSQNGLMDISKKSWIFLIFIWTGYGSFLALLL